jgi:very-short-patch-repair endonuclease
MSRYSIGRRIAKDIMTRDKHGVTYRRIQNEAKNRSGSVQVDTPYGGIWMSAIEHELYEAMREQGLSPEPQLCIGGYFVDFAFEDVKVAVEADGATYHSGERHERDAARDAVLGRAGWKVMRFYGTAIHSKAANCVNAIKREVEGRRAHASAKAQREERRATILDPFRRLFGRR